MSRKREKKLAAARHRAKEHEEKLKRQAKVKRRMQESVQIDPHKRKQALFAQVYEKYKDEVYKISMYFCHREDVAEEATQKAFFNFYLHFDDVKPECMRAYLLRSVRNLTFNWIRDQKLVREGQIEDLNDDLSVVSVEDVFMREEERRIAAMLSETILSRLYEENKKWYEVMVLTCYLGKQNIQVAKELGVSKDVINSRMYRARKWIRQTFREEYERVKEELH